MNAWCTGCGTSVRACAGIHKATKKACCSDCFHVQEEGGP